MTDSSDPYFLHHLQINEDDFHMLKTEQNLLVEFEKFPLKFVELLEACITSHSEENPKFVCKLISEPQAEKSVFSIVETNSFKHINHLSLSFIPGDDATIKQYLAFLVKEFKAEISVLNKRLSQTEENLGTKISEDESVISMLSRDLDKLKLSHQQERSDLQLNHAKALSNEREKAITEADNIRRQYEGKIRDLERQHELEVFVIYFICRLKRFLKNLQVSQLLITIFHKMKNRLKIH